MLEKSSTINKLAQLLAAPTVDPSQRASRIRTVETDIVLPIKGLIIIILTYYFFFSDWYDKTGAREWILAIIRDFFLVYVLANAAAGLVFARAHRIPLKWVEWLVFGVGILDGFLMAGLITETNGSDSILYWMFPVVILHNAMAIPVAIPQLLLNIFVSSCYLMGDRLDSWLGIMAQKEFAEPPEILAKLGKTLPTIPTTRILEDQRVEKPLERMIVLVLWAVCCYGIQMLFEKQKRQEAEATEFAVRQERLHTAGRLAAEIAHKIKNPLGIITNAAFCLKHAVRDGQTAVDEQIEIIREEVERADRILTELMGYAQLAEGKVEKIEVNEALDQAIQEVFPPAAKYQVKVTKNCASPLPSLLMQRRHISDVLVNLMQNAREAMNGCGEIQVTAHFGDHDSIVIEILDTGPGIAPDKIGKIFDAYFTTRAKGTGLGLAIVKHNTEMYGGTVRVHSELGKGTRFILEFPPRILMKLNHT